MKTITAVIIIAASLMPTPAEQAADAAEASRMDSAAAAAKATALALEHAQASPPAHASIAARSAGRDLRRAT